MLKRLILFTILFIFTIVENATSQCAMCRATVENNVSNGEAGIANTLNFGILYLFAAPYLIVMVIGFLWYKKSKEAGRKVTLKELLARKKS